MASSQQPDSTPPTSRTPASRDRRASARAGTPSDSESTESSVPVPDGKHYDIEATGGRVAHGTVWKAIDRRTRRTVALKRVRPELAGSRELMSRVRRDLKVLTKLQHPGIVQPFELEKDADGFFLVLEWVDGRSLAEIVETSGPLDEKRAVDVAARMAEALHAAHQRKVTHRNVSPASILLTSDGTARLTDFGLMRVDVESLLEELESADFVAPELLVNPRDVSFQSDIWSLAATLYHLFTGWTVSEFEASLIPAALRDPLLCALADQPAHRFKDARGFAAALRGDRSEIPDRKFELPAPRVSRPPVADDSTESDQKPASKGGVFFRARPTGKKSAEADDAEEGTEEPAQPSAGRKPGSRPKTQRTTAETKKQPATDSQESQTAPQQSTRARRSSKRRSTTTTDSPATAGTDRPGGRVTRPRRPLIILDESEQPPADGDSAAEVSAAKPSDDQTHRPRRRRLSKAPSDSTPAASDEVVAESESDEVTRQSETPRARRRLLSKTPSEAAPSGEVAESESVQDRPEQGESPQSRRTIRFGRQRADENDSQEAPGSTDSSAPDSDGRAASSRDESNDGQPSQPQPSQRRTTRRQSAQEQPVEQQPTKRRRAKPQSVGRETEKEQPGPERGSQVRPASRRRVSQDDRTRDAVAANADSTAETESSHPLESSPTAVETESSSQPYNSAQGLEVAESEAAKSETELSQAADAQDPIAATSLGDSGTEPSTEPVAASEDDDHEDLNRRTKSRSNTLVAGWSVALLFVLAVVISLNSGGNQSASTSLPVNPDGQHGNTSQVPSGADDSFTGEEITVGPSGQFKSLKACMDHLRREAYRYADRTRRQNVRVLVSGDKTYGPLVIDNSTGSYPDGIHIIAADGARPVLSAPGKIPILLRAVRNFRLEGFDVDATESDVAIEIAGLVPSSRLVDMNVSGFRECGLLTKGAAGEVADELVIDSVRFESTFPDAVGIRMTGREDVMPTRTQVVQCRVTGPLHAGILLEGGCEFLELRENIIDGAVVGIRFSGESVNWVDLLIANSTFYYCGTAGMSFSHMPMTGGIRGTQLAFYRNLFAGCGGPELIFEQGFDAQRFDKLISTVGGNGIRENWSDHSVPADPVFGEAEIVNVDTATSIPIERRVESIEFQSTDQSDANFLMLPAESPFSFVGTPRVGTRPWIGALPPVARN